MSPQDIYGLSSTVLMFMLIVVVFKREALINWPITLAATGFGVALLPIFIFILIDDYRDQKNYYTSPSMEA